MTGDGGSAIHRRLARRRLLAAIVVAVVAAGPPLLFGHRGLHASMSLLVPGAGIYGTSRVAAIALGAMAVIVTGAWLRWGVDWAVAGVTAAAMGLSAAFPGASVADGSLPINRLAHEFPLVVLVVVGLGWVRSALRRVPGVRRVVASRRRPARPIGALPPVLRCRVAAVQALAGTLDDAGVAALRSPEVARRARRVGIVARGRFGGDPFRRDHAAARAALALSGQLEASGVAGLRADAASSWTGVVCSEPGFVRPLDAMLLCLAVDDPAATAAWRTTLATSFGLRRGHRPAWLWTPLGVSAGRAPAWEHAAFTALARSAGLPTTDGDWTALRPRALGAAARGVADRDDERLVAAARCWLAFVDDPLAHDVLARPTVRWDPLAVALDQLATSWRRAPETVRSTSVADDRTTGPRPWWATPNVDRVSEMRRITSVIVLLVGIALSVGTLLAGGLGRATAGEELLTGARDSATVEGSARLGADADLITDGVDEVLTGELPTLRQALGLGADEFDTVLAAQYPAVAAGITGFAEADASLAKIVANLQKQAADYEEADALPVSFVSLTVATIATIVSGSVLVALGVVALRGRVAWPLAAAGAMCLVFAVAMVATRSPQKGGAAERVLDSLNITTETAQITTEQFEGAAAFLAEYQDELVPDAARALGVSTQQLTGELDAAYPKAALLRTDRFDAALTNIGEDAGFRRANVDNLARVKGFPLGTVLWVAVGLFAVTGLLAVVTARSAPAAAPPPAEPRG